MSTEMMAEIYGPYGVRRDGADRALDIVSRQGDDGPMVTWVVMNVEKARSGGAGDGGDGIEVPAFTDVDHALEHLEILAAAYAS